MTDGNSRNNPTNLNREFNTAQEQKIKHLNGSLNEVSIPLVNDNKIVSQKIDDVESFELLKSGRNSKLGSETDHNSRLGRYQNY